MKNFLVHNDEVKNKMLSDIGLNSISELFKQIPDMAKMSELKLDEPCSEIAAQREIKALAKENKSDFIDFKGGGVYNKFVPACLSQIAQRWEFLTAYTPYQAEISQGTLQIMYEFQTMIARLTGMDIANATVYDGATACAEAVLMAVRISKKDKALINKNINPEYLDVIKTYTWASGIKFDLFDEVPENVSDYACVLVQTPDYYGEIKKLPEVEGALLIACVDLSSLSLLEPPVQADIVVGDVQTLGIPMSFGGPHAGVIACKEKYMRQMPGRLAGRTVDADGNQAFTLTIQTREQHIKREKATSNICSNQALIGLLVTAYLSVMGEKGFRQAGYLSAKNAHLLADKLKAKGYKIQNRNFYNEFVVETDNADEFLKQLELVNISGGIKLDDARILVAVTEMISDEDIELYVQTV
ncbi:MAG: aminomethyl-transferring glycine dehydrogenase subunit GcvPA [Candidatus Gastranaerophilaceae bacterium]|nr:aminomethyl-transferring glycine dehydrogenase subunit GcvPA [Candidatus Gastranaerophilaceae bacterium]